MIGVLHIGQYRKMLYFFILKNSAHKANYPTLCYEVSWKLSVLSKTRATTLCARACRLFQKYKTPVFSLGSDLWGPRWEFWSYVVLSSSLFQWELPTAQSGLHRGAFHPFFQWKPNTCCWLSRKGLTMTICFLLNNVTCPGTAQKLLWNSVTWAVAEISGGWSAPQIPQIPIWIIHEDPTLQPTTLKESATSTLVIDTIGTPQVMFRVSMGKSPDMLHFKHVPWMLNEIWIWGLLRLGQLFKLSSWTVLMIWKHARPARGEQCHPGVLEQWGGCSAC